MRDPIPGSWERYVASQERPEVCPRCGAENCDEEGNPVYDEAPDFCSETCYNAAIKDQEIDNAMWEDYAKELGNTEKTGRDWGHARRVPMSSMIKTPIQVLDPKEQQITEEDMRALHSFCESHPITGPVLEMEPIMEEQKLVYDMMVALDLPLPNDDAPSVQGLSSLNFELLRNLVTEEAAEFDEAMAALDIAMSSNCGVDPVPHWAEVIDAMCDLIVVIHNTSNAMGINLKPFFDEVHRTNMAKVGGPVREDGKRLKPEGWKPPRIKEMLLELLESHKKEEGE